MAGEGYYLVEMRGKKYYLYGEHSGGETNPGEGTVPADRVAGTEYKVPMGEVYEMLELTLVERPKEGLDLGPVITEVERWKATKNGNGNEERAAVSLVCYKDDKLTVVQDRVNLKDCYPFKTTFPKGNRTSKSPRTYIISFDHRTPLGEAYKRG